MLPKPGCRNEIGVHQIAPNIYAGMHREKVLMSQRQHNALRTYKKGHDLTKGADPPCHACAQPDNDALCDATCYLIGAGCMARHFFG